MKEAKGDQRFHDPPRHEPELDLDLAASERAAARCPHCHGALEEDAYRCNSCRARFHLGCLGEGQRRGCSLCGGAVVPERRTARNRIEAAQHEARVSRRATVAGALTTVVATFPWCVVSTAPLWSSESLKQSALAVFLLAIVIPLGGACLTGGLAAHLVRRMSRADPSKPDR